MPTMTPTAGTPYRVVMPVEMADVAAAPESAMTSAFGSGGQRYRCQNSCGQRLYNKSPMSVHDRFFQSNCNVSDKREAIWLPEKSIKLASHSFPDMFLRCPRDSLAFGFHETN
jgi:hypothetical protein